MKKLLFAAHSLGLGGIETALITLVEQLVKKGYQITLVLEKKQGIFLDTLNPKIKVIEYSPSDNKIIPLRKFINLCKQLKFKFRFKNKFDFAAAYATYSLSNGFVARVASKNSALWVHLDYLTQNNYDEEKTKDYYQKLKCEQFKKIVFVSKESRDNFIKIFPHYKEKAIYCNNLIDGKKIIQKAEEKLSTKQEGIGIDQNKSSKQENSLINQEDETANKQGSVIFLNVGRHDEKQKKLSRLIEVAEMLKKDNFKFKILFVGDGPDSTLYKQMVENKSLTDTIIFLGKKKNPYPYYKLSNCVVLTSDYEGYPVVFLESMILKKPIITTKVSDFKQIENKFGIVTTKNVKDIYDAMKNFIQNGFEIKAEFDYQKYNEEILKKLEEIF